MLLRSSILLALHELSADSFSNVQSLPSPHMQHIETESLAEGSLTGVARFEGKFLNSPSSGQGMKALVARFSM